MPESSRPARPIGSPAKGATRQGTLEYPVLRLLDGAGHVLLSDSGSVDGPAGSIYHPKKNLPLRRPLGLS